MDSICIIKTIVPIIKDSILTITAIIASTVGLIGLTTWKKQYKTQTEYNLAKSIILSLYKLKSAIEYFRHPVVCILNNEEHAEALQKKWNPISNSKLELDAKLVEAEVVWGNLLTSESDKLNSLILKLLVSLEDYIQEKDLMSPEELKDLKKIIIYKGSKDFIQDDIDTIFKNLINLLKPYIRKFHNKS